MDRISEGWRKRDGQNDGGMEKEKDGHNDGGMERATRERITYPGDGRVGGGLPSQLLLPHLVLFVKQILRERGRHREMFW